jgi:hypothetical protein
MSILILNYIICSFSNLYCMPKVLISIHEKKMSSTQHESEPKTNKSPLITLEHGLAHPYVSMFSSVKEDKLTSWLS